jgi:hypothetical protein
MAVLTEDAKITLVQALACYDTPTQAVEAVAQAHGVKIERMQAGKYDPTKPGGRNLSQKLKDIFFETRRAFLEDVSTIPISQQAYRLRVLQKNLERADNRGNAAMVTSILEQAAKELGGAFTNRRELSGPGGEPLPSTPTTIQLVAPDVDS